MELVEIENHVGTRQKTENFIFIFLYIIYMYIIELYTIECIVCIFNVRYILMIVSYNRH